MAASPYDGLYWDTHIPLGVHKMLQDLAGKNPSDPNLPDAWSPSDREWFSLPRSATNYSLKHSVYTFGSVGNFFSADGGRTVLGDNNFTADQGNDVDYTQGGAAAQVGRSLNPAVFQWIPVAYNTKAYPISDALQSAVDKTVNMILSSVGGVFLIGNGLGAVVASGVYDEFRTGRLMSRRSDLLGVYNFGSPLRQAGHTIPGGTDPGGHGMAPAAGTKWYQKRLTTTEDLVWEFANPLDPVTVVGDTSSADSPIGFSGLPEFTGTKAQFYIVPSTIPAGNPGDIVRWQKIDLPPGLNLINNLLGGAWGADAYRIMYLSTDTLGSPCVVTGSYLEPNAPWKGRGSRPILSYSVGTYGTDNDGSCPSKLLGGGIFWQPFTNQGFQPFDFMMGGEEIFWNAWNQQGVAIVATDYQGRGVSAQGYPYLLRVPAAHAVLDAARAAKKFTDMGYTSLRFNQNNPANNSPIGLWGYSEGGGAAAAAAELAETYAPDLDIAAAWVGGPAVHIGDPNFLDYNNNAALSGGIGYILNALINVYPSIRNDVLNNLTPAGKVWLADTYNQVLPQTVAQYGFHNLQEWFTSDPKTLWASKGTAWHLNEQYVGNLKPNMPVYIASARNDPVVPYAWPTALLADWKAQGADVILRPVEAPVILPRLMVDHVLGYFLDLDAGMAWMKDKFDNFGPRALKNYTPKRTYQGKDSATLFTVRGTFGRAIEIAMGNELGNYDTMVGLGVDKNYWNWVDVDYPGDKLSFNAWFKMDQTEKQGKEILIDLINKTPGKFALCGTSQGAAVISSVYKEIQSGVLQERKKDLIAGITFGNPRRQVGHTIPRGIDPGVHRGASATHGLLGPGLLTNVDSNIWWDFANPNDFASDIADDTNFGLCSQAVFQFMYENPTTLNSYVSDVKQAFRQGKFSGVSADLTVITGVAQVLVNLFFAAATAAIDFTNPSDGHLRYHLPYPNLPGNTKNAVQLAIERLNGLPYNTNIEQAQGKPITARTTARLAGGKIKTEAYLDVSAIPPGKNVVSGTATSSTDESNQ